MANITDVKPKRGKPFAHSVIAPIGTIAELETANGLFNSYQEDTKRYGSVVIASGATVDAGHVLAMAVGKLYNDKWTMLDVADDILVNGATLPDVHNTDRKPAIKKRKLGSLDFPVVLEADLASGDHSVNSSLLGGKKFGAAVICKLATGIHTLVIAGGSLPTDKWHKVDGSAVITPTAETPIPQRPSGDKKPVVKQVVVSAVPFPVALTAALTAAASVVNTGDGSVSGKRKGSLVVEKRTDGVPLLRMALGSLPESPWCQVLGNDTSGALTPS